MLGKIIIEALGKYKSIHLEGLGCFYIRQVTSYGEQSDNLSVHPPLKAILYKEHCENSLDLEQIGILESWSVDQVEEVDQLVRNQIDLLLADGFSVIEGLGTLKRESDQSIFLQIDHNPFVRDMNVLPELDISFESHDLAGDQVEPPKLKQEHIALKKTALTTNNTTEFKKLGIALFLIVLISLASVLLVKSLFFQKPDGGKYKKELNAQTKSTELPAVRDMFANDQLNKYGDVLSEENISNGCEIVVGAFKRSQNAEKLASEVRLLNYKTSVIQNEKLYRVVINFDCLKNDLIDYLLKVREEVNPQAWYLSPENYDPFR